MKDEDGRTLAICAGVTAYALAYLCAAFLEWPTLTYFPERDTFRFVAHAPVEAIRYGGLVLWGVLAGVDAAVVTLVAARVLGRRAPSRTFAALCTGWTLMALMLAAAYFAMRARA